MTEVEEETFAHIEVVPPEPILEPIVYKEGTRLFMEEGAELPLEACFCCGKRAVKTVHKSLRSPSNPLTWIGKKQKIAVGLCRQHGDSKAIALALTWSLLTLGLIFLAAGTVIGSLTMIVLALIAILFCGIFRAALPVRTPDPSAEPVELRGFGPKYLGAIEVEYEAEGE